MGSGSGVWGCGNGTGGRGGEVKLARRYGVGRRIGGEDERGIGNPMGAGRAEGWGGVGSDVGERFRMPRWFEAEKGGFTYNAALC